MFVHTAEIKGNRKWFGDILQNVIFCSTEESHLERHDGEGEAFLCDKNALLSLLYLS